MTFKLHHQLDNDSITIGEFKLSRVLLINDNRYPWFVLVPQRPDITEIFQLSEQDQLQLNKESIYLSQQLARLFSADKMNIAALGNVVPQLHIHHVVRYKNDSAWPAPIWGVGEAVRFSEEELEKVIVIANEILADFNA